MASILYSFLLSWIVTVNAGPVAHPRCQDAACYQGWKIKNVLKPSISPCIDFYRHVCDNYVEKYNQDSFFSEAIDLYETERQYLLQKPISSSDTEATKKVKQHYQSCLSAGVQGNNTPASLKKIIDQLGEWPMFESDERRKLSHTSWINIHDKYVETFGIETSIFHLNVQYDFRHDKFLLCLDRCQSPFGIPVPQEWPKNIKDEYFRFLLSVLRSMPGITATDGEIYKSLQEVYEFRQKILEIYYAPRNHSLMTVNEWQNEYDANIKETESNARMNWLRLLNLSFKDVKGIHINGDTEISVFGKVYLLELIPLLETTNARTIVNHLHLHFLEKIIKYSDENVIFKLRRFNENFDYYDPQLHQDRNWTCMLFLGMSHAVEKMYVNNRVPAGFMDNVSSMYSNIKEALKKEINASKRVSDAGKIKLIEKTNNITEVLGFPTWYNDDDKIAGFYKNIKIGSDFLQNMFSIERYNYLQYLSMLSNDSDREPSPLQSGANAFYTPTKNSIELSLSILQPPFFYVLWPDEMNYAMAGSVIAHEISHAFDYAGFRLTADGKKDEWISDADNRTFEVEADCYAEQYLDAVRSIYSQTNINPYEFLQENIPDGQGIRIAYKAYKANRKPPSRIKYLEEYSPEQIFFLSYALSKCHKQSLDDMIENLVAPKDFHAIPNFRVNGPLANMPEFGEAFACPPGTPMNPTRKCNIWA